jgi:hypothetical protein
MVVSSRSTSCCSTSRAHARTRLSTAMFTMRGAILARKARRGTDDPLEKDRAHAAASGT